MAGLLATAGVAAGLSVHAVIAAARLGALIAGVPLIYEVLRWTGVAYILFLAWEAWKPDDKDHPDFTAGALSSLFWRGFFSNVFNPKSIMFFISVVPGFLRRDSGDPNFSIQFAQLGMTYPKKLDSTNTVRCTGGCRRMARLDDAPNMKGSGVLSI